MSPEIPKTSYNRDPIREQAELYCAHINTALDMARVLRQNPDDAGLRNELQNLVRVIHHEGFAGIYKFKVIIPEGADARTSRYWGEYLDEHPTEFLADKVNKIEDREADFFRGDNSDVHLTSFDLNLTVEPYLPE